MVDEEDDDNAVFTVREYEHAQECARVEGLIEGLERAREILASSHELHAGALDGLIKKAMAEAEFLAS